MAIININKRFKWIEQWKLKDTKLKAFNDGKLWAGTVEREISARRTVQNEVWTPVVQLMYDVTALREEDKQMAYQTNTRVDLKVRVPKNRFLTEDMTVRLDGDFYEVVRKDFGHDATYLFLRKRTSADPEVTVRE